MRPVIMKTVAIEFVPGGILFGLPAELLSRFLLNSQIRFRDESF